MAPAAMRVILSAFMAIAALGARAQSVGNVGAVNQTARGTPPGQAARVLALGAGVVDRERVETSGDGNAQIVFLDTSTLTIGRNSAVTIDRFVYGGDAGAGAQAISAAKGVLRFVGGGVSHGGNTTIRTPAATIGVRGGTALFALGEPDCGTLVVNQYGLLTVAARGGSATLPHSGFGVCVASDGASVSEPFRVPAETIARLNARLGSGPRQTAGAIEPPTNFEAHRRLGDNRPPNDLVFTDNTPGLDDLDVIWTGNALAQSRAGVENQPPPPAPRFRPRPPGRLVGGFPTNGNGQGLGNGAVP